MASAWRAMIAPLTLIFRGFCLELTSAGRATQRLALAFMIEAR
jgi:hypothetical protein